MQKQLYLDDCSEAFRFIFRKKIEKKMSCLCAGSSNFFQTGRNLIHQKNGTWVLQYHSSSAGTFTQAGLQ
jgi:hypothetical protein